jgi:protein-tyrosine phosphatase
LSLYWIKTGSSFRLATAARPRGDDWLGDELQRWRASGVQVLVSMLTHDEMNELGLAQEHSECSRCGIEYLNFPIEDRGVPNNALEFGKFVDKIVARLKARESVVVHCRAGIGRSSLLACSVLVRFGVACSQAWLLVQEARGCPVPDTNEQKSFLESFAKS